MPIELSLKALPVPQIGVALLSPANQILEKITGNNLAKATQGSESPVFKNRKEEMKRRLSQRSKGSTFEQVTDVVGRERILLSLYLEYGVRSDASSWLPKFDEVVANSVLGGNGREWHAGRRRQATQLFFTHFDRLPALSEVCDRLLESYSAIDAHASSLAIIWQQNRSTIFAIDGPQRVALAAKERETLSELMARFAIPNKNEERFSARLKECFLLARLQMTEVGQGQEILQELEAMRTLPYQMGVTLGAAALRIMTRKVLESRGEWKGDWPAWILRIGCDPSLPASSEQFGKWWGCWHPTRAELDCAQRGINRQTLEYFIQFLEVSLSGTAGYDQFEARASFLRWLDDTRKILRFKLLLHPRAFQALPSAYRQQRHRVAQIEGTGQGTSVIVIECIDEVWIAEGTHSFAIRAFRQEFPVPEVFLEDRHSYLYSTFTQGAMHRDSCAGIWKAHMGDWISNLLWQMQWKFHIEPPWRYR